jgi:predicted ribosomally synthesized peptide with SipW-like signal peptide
MTDERFDISRRKALAALGTIGVASAGAGLGTSAYFSDQETFENNSLTAGELDLVAAASSHYVDWLPNTAGGPASPQETDDAGMPDSPEDANLVLGPGDYDDAAEPIELDISDPAGLASGSLVNTINGGASGADTDGDGTLCDEDLSDADGPVIVDLDDVKPGDFGIIRFAFSSCDNPAFLWCNGNLTDASENGYTEPELDDPDEDGPNSDETVELVDAIRVATVPGDVAGSLSSTDTLEVPGTQSLRDLLEGGKEMPLDGDIEAPEGGGSEAARNCFSGSSVHFYSFVWWLPIDHGNEVQGDSAEFTLGLYAEQCRHNDGVLNNQGVDPAEIDDDEE